MKKKVLILTLIFSTWALISAQKRIGTWTSHLPYGNASEIILAGNKTFCSTSGGLFYYDKSDNSIGKLSKENGLSDTEISALGYAPDPGILIIAYSNANIDFIHNDTIINFPDILRKQIMGDKQIYSIFVNGNFAYLSTGFGIVALNLSKREISWSIDKMGEGGVQIKVNQTCIFGSYLFAATDQGIYKAELNSDNLQDFNFWNRITDIPGYFDNFNSIISFNGLLYTSHKSFSAAGDVIYYYDGSIWNKLSFNDDDCNHFSEWDGNLIVSARFHVMFFKDGVKTHQYYINAPKTAYVDNNSVLWVADSEKGLVKKDLISGEMVLIEPNGPATMFVSDIQIANNTVYAVPGGITSSNNNMFIKGVVNIFKNNEWIDLKHYIYKDFFKIAIDPTNPDHYFVGSWGYGLFEFNKDSLYNIYRENSSLQTVIPGDFYRIGGLAYDRNKNLWITNASVPKPVSVFTKDGKWINFDLNSILPTTINFGDIIEAQSGYKWMILTSHSRGLFIMDDNGTLENPDDDRYKSLDIKDEDNNLVTNDVYAITEDRSGNIWVGTNKGILVYYNPWAVFDYNIAASYITIPKKDNPEYGDHLLETETVTAIAVDGANRKWIGTRNAGVTLVSEDGQKQIYNFRQENSPLLSNTITSIAINNNTGEVFFGTDKGIISFVAEATGPSENYNSVLVSPNPVRESYTGDISISGLMENTLLKITDLNGNIVFETISFGGRALWNGKNFNGERVGTGVYLVFCSNEDGSLSHVTKLLFIH